MAGLALSITPGLHIPLRRRTDRCLGASRSDSFFQGQGSCLTLANCLPKDLNKPWGLGLHSPMPTSILPNVSSALHSAVSFSLPSVTLGYFVFWGHGPDGIIASRPVSVDQTHLFLPLSPHCPRPCPARSPVSSLVTPHLPCDHGTTHPGAVPPHNQQGRQRPPCPRRMEHTHRRTPTDGGGRV